MPDYINRDALVEEQRNLYCKNCAKRKGMKNGKMRTLYAVGDVPCRSCGIGDVLDEVEEYPTVDVPAKSKSYLFTYCYESGDHSLGFGSVTMTQREFTPINQTVIDDAVEWVRKLIGLPETQKIVPLAFIRFEEGNEDG